MGNAVEEVGRSIEGVDDPPGLDRVALDLAALLEQHAPVRARIPELLDDRLLGALVGHRDEVRRTLAADLQVLDLAKVTAQARRRLVRGALHDGDQAGMGYHSRPPFMSSEVTSLDCARDERLPGNLNRPFSHIPDCTHRRRSWCRLQYAGVPSRGPRSRAKQVYTMSLPSAPSPPHRPRR